MTKKINLHSTVLAITLTVIMIFMFIPEKAVANSAQESRIMNVEPEYIMAIDMEDLEERAEYILRVKILEEKETVIHHYIAGIFPDGYTKRDVEILEVYKGNFNEGDIIQIGEPYFETILREGLSLNLNDISDGGEYTVTFCGYEPSIPGDEYLLFLKEAKSDKLPAYYNVHQLVSSGQGAFKLNIEPQNLLKVDTEKKSGNHSIRRHGEIYNEVIDKYGVSISDIQEE